MKLIDLLVQELPKRGGWPNGTACVQDDTGQLWFFHNGLPEYENGIWCADTSTNFFDWTRWGIFLDKKASDNKYFIVAREQYEAALAASQQPVWDGEGLPPVGCECESLHCFVGSEWQRIIVKWSDEKQFLYEWVRDGHPVHHVLGYVGQHTFRPIRTEAERKREEVVKQILKGANLAQDNVAEAVYDAIAAGKVPGVTLL